MSVNLGETDLIAFRVGAFDMKIIRAPSNRVWIDQTTRSFANRCLPMHIANQAGWFVLNDRALRAIWRGGIASDAVVIEQMGSPPFSALSHFGHGILTFTMPYLFRTSRGVSLLFRGPANDPKDGIAALEGLVETDWAVATAAMSWKFTRPNTWIEFAQGDPICMIVPQRLSHLEQTSPRHHHLNDDQELRERYHAWRLSRDNFARQMKIGDPEAVKQGWQRHYFQGSAPQPASKQPMVAEDHRTRLRLNDFATRVNI